MPIKTFFEKKLFISSTKKDVLIRINESWGGTEGEKYTFLGTVRIVPSKYFGSIYSRVTNQSFSTYSFINNIKFRNLKFYSFANDSTLSAIFRSNHPKLLCIENSGKFPGKHNWVKFLFLQCNFTESNFTERDSIAGEAATRGVL